MFPWELFYQHSHFIWFCSCCEQLLNFLCALHRKIHLWHSQKSTIFKMQTLSFEYAFMALRFTNNSVIMHCYLICVNVLCTVVAILQNLCFFFEINALYFPILHFLPAFWKLGTLTWFYVAVCLVNIFWGKYRKAKSSWHSVEARIY